MPGSYVINKNKFKNHVKHRSHFTWEIWISPDVFKSFSNEQMKWDKVCESYLQLQLEPFTSIHRLLLALFPPYQLWLITPYSCWSMCVCGIGWLVGWLLSLKCVQETSLYQADFSLIIVVINIVKLLLQLSDVQLVEISLSSSEVESWWGRVSD